MKPSLSRPQLLCGAYVVLHTLAHVSANWFEVKPGIAVSIWYPPAGLALSLLVLLGPRYTPVVFLTNLATAWLTATHRIPWTGVFFPALLTVNYATVAWLVRRHFGPRLLPGGRHGTLVFCLVVGGAPLVAALIGTTVIHVTASAGVVLTAAEFLRSVVDWWIGDASGLLTVVPVAMVFVAPWLAGEPGVFELRRWRIGQMVLALFRALILLGTLILVLAVPSLREHSAFYLCFLPLVWICVHHGLPGATLATLLVMMVGLVGMRLLGTTVEFSYIFLLFEVAVAGVGLGLGTLVTRRNEAETKLATSQAQLDRVIAGAQLGLWDWNVATGQVDTNERLAAMLGYGREEIEPLHERWPALIHPADNPQAQTALTDHLEGRTGIYEAEFRLRARDGHWRWIHSRGSVVLRDSSQQPLRVSGTHLDITDRKRAEAEVARLLKIIEATPDFILTADAEGRVIYANAALLAIWGQPEPGAPWAGRLLREIFPGEAGRQLSEEALPLALAQGAWRGEVTLADRRGRTIPTSQVVIAHRDEESDAFTFSFIMRDISEQKRAEAERIEHEREMLQLQKTESLGVLAGGIAHDFNNLLTAVVGNANLARFELPPGMVVQSYLGNIEQAATRASALCHQMLTYAGRSPVAFAEVDLNQLVEETLQLFEPGLSKKIAVRYDPGQPLTLILASNTQVQQVVMNLALNAAEAIGDGEGRLVVRTRSRHFETAELAGLFRGQSLPAGNYVFLEVEDTGCGMTPEVRARIFEPFFTTKFTGQGLGLAAVSGVVRSHRGAMTVRSSPGAGSLFRIAFPALQARPVPAAPAPESDDTWRGSGLILVVDDDRIIQKVTSLLLETLGFTVVIATDGVEGVAAFREQAARLKCVLLDLTMPRMDGFEAHAEMHRHNPAVPVILMSGFSQKLFNLPPAAIHPAGIMAKPFGLKQLRARLKAVLAPAG